FMAQTTTPTYDDENYLGPDPELERLYDNVQAQCSSVLLSVVKMAVWNTVEDFYIRSTWRREQVWWCMAPGQSCIDFNPFSGDWLAQWILEHSGLSFPQIQRPAKLIDAQCPPVDGERHGYALLALKPVSLDSVCDSDLLTTWFETILDGTL